MKFLTLIFILSFVWINAHISVFEQDTTTWTNYFRDYLYVLKNNLQWTEKNVILRIYLSSTTNSVTDLIVRNFCSLGNQRTIRISTADGDFLRQSVSEKIGIAIVNDEQNLKSVLSMLYYRTQHEYNIVCITYPINQVTANLSVVTSEIWTKGLSRNIFFIVMSMDRMAIVIIRAPSYQLGYCNKGKLVEVGYVQNENYTSIRNDFLPRFDNLGGCDLNIMVLPPFPPYIKNRSPKPGGMIGMLIDQVSKALNFTPKYKWAFGGQLSVKHYRDNNLNILFDLLPIADIPVHKFSFNFGLVKSSFVVHRSKHYSDSTNLLNPFNYSVWICLAITLVGLTIFIYFKTDFNFMYIFLKVYGILLGISGQIPKTYWFQYFFSCWLLPSYIIQQFYIASLMKNMAIVEPKGEINTVPELVDSNMQIICSFKMKMYFCKSISPDHMEYLYLCSMCQQIKDKYIFKKLYPAAMAGEILNNSAFFANEEVIKFSKGYRYIRFNHASTVALPQTVSVRPGNPYIFHINLIYFRCVEAGLFEYWKRRNKPLIIFKKNITFVDIVNDKLRKCFIIVFIGWIISVLIFLLEIAVFKRHMAEMKSETNLTLCSLFHSILQK